MIKNLFVMWRLVMTATHNGKLPQPIPSFGLPFTGFMPCSDTLVLVASVQHCRPNTIIITYRCTLNILLVMVVNEPNPLALAMAYYPIMILLVLLGRKLQLIPFAHGLCQHHMILWNSLLSLVLTPPLILSKLRESSKNPVTMLLPVLSTPGFPGTLNPCESSMTMGERIQVLPLNSFFAC